MKENELTIGMKLEVKSAEGEWLPATVIKWYTHHKCTMVVVNVTWPTGLTGEVPRTLDELRP